MAKKGDVKMGNSRTENVARNASYAAITQVAKILLSFISRTVFIYVLGVDYLGVNGLFTNILLLLSFAELGIGNAMIYGMYKPLAIRDKDKVKSLMCLYAKSYKIIGIFIFLVGILLIPFLDHIIKDSPNISENLNLIYVLFLLNTVVSYFYIYKSSIIEADQKKYIVSIYNQVFHIIEVIVQIIILLLTKNYILFLIVQITCTILNNLFLAKKANKMYPFLKIGKAKSLDKNERKKIFINIKSLFLYKLGSVILNGSDNIIISAMIGVAAVGLSSNYLLIISAFTAISGQVMGAFTSSLGNLNAIGKKSSKERVFYKVFFISAWIYGFISIGLLLLLNPFINLWLGNQFILSEGVVFAIVLHFYINSMHFTAYTYRITMGLFVQGRYAPLAAAIINIILSIWLGNKYGLIGIFLATSFARVFTTGIVDPILIYRIGFKKNPFKYYIKYLLYTTSFIGIFLILNFIIEFVRIDGIIGFIIQLAIVTLLFNFLYLLLFRKTHEYVDIKKIVKKVIKNKLSKR